MFIKAVETRLVFIRTHVKHNKKYYKKFLSDKKDFF